MNVTKEALYAMKNDSILALYYIMYYQNARKATY